MDYNVTSSRPPSTSLPNHNTECLVGPHHRAAGQGNMGGDQEDGKSSLTGRVNRDLMSIR